MTAIGLHAAQDNTSGIQDARVQLSLVYGLRRLDDVRRIEYYCKSSVEVTADCIVSGSRRLLQFRQG